MEESDVLNVVTCFGGRPEVKSAGDIMHVFPEFMTLGGTSGRTSGSPAPQSLTYRARRKVFARYWQQVLLDRAVQ